MRAREISAALLASSAAAFALIAAGACSSKGDDGNGVDPTHEAGPGEEGGVEDAGKPAVADGPIIGPQQKGRIVDALGKNGLAGAVVTIAGKSVSTADDGTYAISIPKDVPYSMTVTGDEHYKLNEQEWIVKTDLFDRSDTSLLSNGTATFLTALLPAFDKAKGILAVRIYPMAPCDSEEGSTLSIEPAGTSKVTYFFGGQPNKTKTSTQKDQSFSGIFTDVDVAVPIKVIVNSPLCEQLPFPVDFQGVTYTGQQKTEAGEVISYIRVFIGPKKIADSGTD
jgi:hypothetical protein